MRFASSGYGTEPGTARDAAGQTPVPALTAPAGPVQAPGVPPLPERRAARAVIPHGVRQPGRRWDDGAGVAVRRAVLRTDTGQPAAVTAVGQRAIVPAPTGPAASRIAPAYEVGE